MEEILVCLSGAPSNVRVIKAAAKMAEAYGGFVCRAAGFS